MRRKLVYAISLPVVDELTGCLLLAARRDDAPVNWLTRTAISADYCDLTTAWWAMTCRETERSIDVGSGCRRPYINSSSTASPGSSSSSSIDNDDAPEGRSFLHGSTDFVWQLTRRPLTACPDSHSKHFPKISFSAKFSSQVCRPRYIPSGRLPSDISLATILKCKNINLRLRQGSVTVSKFSHLMNSIQRKKSEENVQIECPQPVCSDF